MVPRRAPPASPGRRAVHLSEARSNLLRAEPDAYIFLLPILANRGLGEEELPKVAGVPMASAALVEKGLEAAAAAQDQVEVRRAAALAAEAARDADIAAAELEREAIAARGDGSVDSVFAKAHTVPACPRASSALQFPLTAPGAVWSFSGLRKGFSCERGGAARHPAYDRGGARVER